MNPIEYRRAIAEVFQIEAVLMEPAQRKNVRLILRHMELCSRIRAYDLELHPRGHTESEAA